MPSTIEEQIEVLNKDYGGMDALGGPKLDVMYHHGWAYAGASPFQGTKLVAAYIGGTRTPMVISWPAKIKHDGKPRSQFHHVNDIAATFMTFLISPLLKLSMEWSSNRWTVNLWHIALMNLRPNRKKDPIF